MAMRRFVDEQIQSQINHTRDRVSQGLIDAVDQLLEKLISLVKDQVSLVLDLDNEIKFLKKVLPKLNEVILNAEVASEEMAGLGGVLKDFVEVAEDIVDEFDTELARCSQSPIADQQRNNYTRRWVVWAGLLMGEQRSKTLVKLVCGCFPFSLWFHSCDHESVSLFFYAKIANQIKGLYGGLETLNNDRHKVQLFVDSAIEGMGVVREQTAEVEGLPRWPKTDEVRRIDIELVGRESDKEELIELFLEPLPKPSVVLVVGMGGIGKTTLVQDIFATPDLNQHFPIKKWTCVGDELDPEAVMSDIFGKDNRAEIIQELRGKRFLIVLDDCWRGKLKRWNTLWEPLSHGDGGSKVIITSREDVSGELQSVPVKLYELSILSDEDCLKIFESYAFPDGVPSSSSGSDSTDRLRGIGRKIVDEKIRGVPLAARVLGSSLSYENREDEWLSVLRGVPAGDVMSILMWSYRRLPSHLKRCFAFWSLLPKDHILLKERLVWMWIACGYVQPMADKKLEYIGEYYVDDLVRASLIQVQSISGKWKCTMHDLVHDLAINVSRNGYFIPTNEVVIENQRNHKRLRTLVECNLEDMGISENELKYVRVLAFRDVQPTITINFSNMIHLRYLDLSRVLFDSLPEPICSIPNLQVLILNDEVDFRVRMWKLPNLRHLDGCENLNVDGLGNSTSLQAVNSFNLFKDKDIEELENLKGLQGKLRIRHLNHVRSRESALKARLSNKEYIEELILEWQIPAYDQDSTVLPNVLHNNILENLCPHGNLRILQIKDYMGGQLPSWMVGNHLSKLVELTLLNLHHVKELPPLGHQLVKFTLSNLHHLKELPPLGHLPHLEYLHIYGLRSLQCIGSGFYGTEKEVFPSLKKLYLRYMDVLEEWEKYTFHEARINWFPSLELLEVSNCKELRRMPRLPRHLKRLVIQITSLRALPKIWTFSDRSNSHDLISLQYLEIRYCPLNLDKWFRKYRLPSLVNLQLGGIHNSVDLVINYSRTCLKRIRISDMRALKSITLRNLVPLQESREPDYYQDCIIELVGLPVMNRMIILNCDDGKITAKHVLLQAHRCNRISLLQENGSKFVPHKESTFINGNFVWKFPRV